VRFIFLFSALFSLRNFVKALAGSIYGEFNIAVGSLHENNMDLRFEKIMYLIKKSRRR